MEVPLAAVFFETRRRIRCGRAKRDRFFERPTFAAPPMRPSFDFAERKATIKFLLCLRWRSDPFSPQSGFDSAAGICRFARRNLEIFPVIGIWRVSSFQTLRLQGNLCVCLFAAETSRMKKAQITNNWQISRLEIVLELQI